MTASRLALRTHPLRGSGPAMRKPNVLSFCAPFLVVASVAAASCVGDDAVRTDGARGNDGGGGNDGGTTDSGGGNDGSSTIDSGSDAGLADIDGNVIDSFGKPVGGAT